MSKRFRSNKEILEDNTLVNSGKPEYDVPYQKTGKRQLHGLNGLAPAIPLSFSKQGPYNLLVDLTDVVKQNFKNLMLTEPGERIMDSSFGVGLRRYLFEPKGFQTQTLISERINEQVQTYMSYLNIDNIEFEEDQFDPNYLGISIYYSIPSLKIEDVLSVAVGE